MVVVVIALALLQSEWLTYIHVVAPALQLDVAPIDGIRFAITAFGFYLLGHFVILFFQQLIVYPVDLPERVESHGEQIISKARARRDDYQREVIDKIWRDKREFEAAEVGTVLAEPPRTLQPSDLDEFQGAYKREIGALREMIEHVDDLERKFTRRRTLIGVGEVARDLIRVLPITLVLLLSVLAHGDWSWLGAR